MGEEPSSITGDIRTFIFDDFIHPLDSVNITARADLKDAYITHQMDGDQLARLDIQWQHGETQLHASMNRHFGITTERVKRAIQTKQWSLIRLLKETVARQSRAEVELKRLTPMLTSKGFHSMLLDWFEVIQSGKIASEIVARNIASHQLAEAICQNIVQSVRR